MQSVTPPITYPFEVEDQERVGNTFTYHPPKEGQQKKYERIRAQAKKLAEDVYSFCPPSRERSVSLTKLEEFVMWANASIARNE